MQREQKIPLFLWVATAVLAHLGGYDGADRVATLVERSLELRRFAATVRNEFAVATRPIEVSLLDEPRAPEEEPPLEPKDEKDEPPKVKMPEPLEPEPERPEPKPPELKPVGPKPPELALKIDPPREKKAKEDSRPETTKPPEQPPADQRRIAVKQHVEDKNQPDNPNAEFIGDEANRVKEQSQSRITSTVQDEAKPNPGTAAPASKEPEPGNAKETRVAQDRDQPGAHRAPDPQSNPARVAAIAPSPPGAPPPAPRAPALPPQSEQRVAPAIPADPGRPDTLGANQGAWGIADGKAPSPAQPARKARRKRLPPLPSKDPLFGYGSQALTANGVNLNLSPQTALEAIGRDKLARERQDDAERRRSTHRGSWKTSGLERWRSAIENYVPSVKPGNQTALNTARVPFASYLNQIHNRLHPIFADTFLVSLDSMPASHPLNRRDMFASLEVVLDGQEGRLVRMGVTKGSGVTAFDLGALDSVSRAAPFGPPPPVILSPDGNVYLHWEFHRDPQYACSTFFAHPYMLKAAPRSAPPKLDTPPPRERPERRGQHDRAPAERTTVARGPTEWAGAE